MFLFFVLLVLQSFYASFYIKTLILDIKWGKFPFFAFPSFFRALKFCKLLIWIINHSEVKKTQLLEYV